MYELGDVTRAWGIVCVVPLGLGFVGLTVWRSQNLIHGSITGLLLRLHVHEHGARPPLIRTQSLTETRTPQPDQHPS
jgi:hypothetical protein